MSDQIDIGVIAETDNSKAFARGPRPGSIVPEDHPLVVAYKETRETGVAKTVQTSTPGEVEKLLRKIAKQNEFGVKIRSDENSVSFVAREPFTRKGKATDE